MFNHKTLAGHSAHSYSSVGFKHEVKPYFFKTQITRCEGEDLQDQMDGQGYTSRVKCDCQAKHGMKIKCRIFKKQNNIIGFKIRSPDGEINLQYYHPN